MAEKLVSVHWRYYNTELARELWYLIESLEEMARRWRGSASLNSPQRRCLASTYADHLRDLHRRCLAAPNFNVDVLAYSTVISNHNTPSSAGSAGSNRSPLAQNHQQHPESAMKSVSNSNIPQEIGQILSQPGTQWCHAEDFVNPQNPQTQLDHSMMNFPVNSHQHADELSNISYLLLDQQFMDMDRVISLNDMMFTNTMASSANGGTADPLSGMNTEM